MLLKNANIEATKLCIFQSGRQCVRRSLVVYGLEAGIGRCRGQAVPAQPSSQVPRPGSAEEVYVAAARLIVFFPELVSFSNDFLIEV